MPAYVASASQDLTFPTAGTPQTFAFDAGSAANRFMALLASNRDVSQSHWLDADMLYNGVSLTPFAGAQFGSSVKARGYWLLAPASGSNTVSADLQQDFPSDVEGIVSVVVYSGVDQTTPYTGYTSATGTDATAEVTVASAAGKLVAMMSGWRTFNSTTMTVTSNGAGATKRWDNRFNDHAGVGGDGDGAASVTLTTTDDEASQIEWDAIGFSLNAAATEAPGRVLSYSAFPKHKIAQRARGVS